MDRWTDLSNVSFIIYRTGIIGAICRKYGAWFRWIWMDGWMDCRDKMGSIFMGGFCEDSEVFSFFHIWGFFGLRDRGAEGGED